MNTSELTRTNFNYMGLFTSREKWIHPRSCEVTYEIIYVSEGHVHLKEEDREYALEKGDLIVLRPGVEHYGCKHTENTAFYWIHFSFDKEHPTAVYRNFHNSSLFKKLMHYSHMPNCPHHVKNAVLWHILAEISMCEINSNLSSLGQSIFEWTRINVSRNLTVSSIAKHFGYNSEYISRLIKKQYGISLKALIDDFLMDKAKEYLCNQRYSVKEISLLLEFSSANAFINFFKYHENTSPNKFRNTYSYVHMNKK